MKFQESGSIRILAVDDPGCGLYRNGGPCTTRWKEKTGTSVSMDIRPWAEYPEAVFSELSSGKDTYDAVMLPGFFWLPSMASRGYLAPLEDILRKLEDSWHTYDFDDILPTLREELFFDGTHYLLPSFAEVQTVIYRKDLLESSGLDLAPGPISMERYIEMARALHHPPSVFGTHMKGGPAESFPEWLPFFSACSGNLFSSGEEPLFASSAGKQSLDLMLDLLTFSGPGVESSDNESINSLLRQGKLGIVNHWSGQLGPLAADLDHRYGYTCLEQPWGTVWSFGINAAGKAKEKTLAFLLYATDKEQDLSQGSFSGSPVRRGTYRRNTYPWYTAVSAALERKNSFPSFVRFADISGNLYSMVTDVLARRSSVEEALGKAAEACRKP